MLVYYQLKWDKTWPRNIKLSLEHFEVKENAFFVREGYSQHKQAPHSTEHEFFPWGFIPLLVRQSNM